MLQFPSPIRHRNVWGGVFVLSLLLAALCSWLSGSNPPPPAPPASVVQSIPIPPPPVSPEVHWLAHEISLQQTLDSMGFTVNVPRTFHGNPVLAWNGYRTSDRSDAIEAGRFYTEGSIQVREVSMQSTLGAETTFGTVAEDGVRSPLLTPSFQHGDWFSLAGGRTVSAPASGGVRFYIDHPDASWGPGSQDPLFSTAAENPQHGAQLMVLPALTGGRWVQTGPNSGHWEGGSASSLYLFCWEDLVNGDHDYQDMVYLVGGIRPS